jgi:hypothetical protein
MFGAALKRIAPNAGQSSRAPALMQTEHVSQWMACDTTTAVAQTALINVDKPYQQQAVNM